MSSSATATAATTAQSSEEKTHERMKASKLGGNRRKTTFAIVEDNFKTM